VIGRAKELVSRIDKPERLHRLVPRLEVADLMAESLMRTMESAHDEIGIEAPALRLRWWLLRLAAARLVTRKEAGRRIEFSVTREGEKALASWTAPLRPSGDMDDLLRSAYLAWMTGAGKTEAATLLRQAIRARSRWAAELRDQLAGVELPLAAKPDAVAYRWFRTVVEAERADADEKALESLAKALEWKKGHR